MHESFLKNYFTRKGVNLWASEDLLKRAIPRRISRKSGITDALESSAKEILSDFN